MALEVTWGDENGWHPHYHVLLVHAQDVDVDVDASAIAVLHTHIHSCLTASYRDHGLRKPDQMHAVRIDPNVSATTAGAYIAKGGDWTTAEELSRGDLKTSRAGGRTAFQILADYYQTGDTRDRDLWREYSRVTRGLSAVRWSGRLRAAVLGAAAADRTDEELATEDVNGKLVATLQLSTWRWIRLAKLERALLVTTETGGLDAVRGMLAGCECSGPSHQRR